MKDLRKYLDKRKEAIDLLLALPRSKYSSSTFHKLRVEIKKLDALFDLLDFCSKDFKQKKLYKPFKLIFRQAGKVRELQLEEAMLKKYFNEGSINEYLDRLKGLRLLEKEKFFLILNERLVVNLEMKFLSLTTFLSDVRNEKANSFLVKRENSIKELMCQSVLRRRQIHELRKRIKSLNYNRKSLNFDQGVKSNALKDRLPVLLGKWHDCRVIVNHLNKVMNSDKINPKEINQLEKIKVKITKDSLVLLDKVNAAILVSEFSEG